MRELAPQTEAMIHVGATPDWQVAAFGSVWVANDTISLVQRIDPATNRIVARLRVSHSARPCDGMAAGFGSLWVPDCATQDLDRIDPDTNKVIARIHTGIADFESYIGVGAGSVWIVSAPDELVRVDAATNRVATRIPVPDGSVAATFGFGTVWVTNNQIDAVTKVDPSTNHVAGSIDVGPEPRFLTAGAGHVWVLNQQDGTVSEIDPDTGDVTSIDAGSPGEGGCIATGFGAVWVTIPEFPLTRIDAASGQVTDHYKGPGGDCLSVGSGSVWLSNLHFGMVWRIPPT
jgi:streptogramin lyase